MHEIIICEKPKASEKIASALSGKAIKKNYKRVPYYELQNNGKKTTVMRYNGNAWELVGTNGFSDVGSHDQTLVIYNGIPYVAFADGTSSKVSVMKFW